MNRSWNSCLTHAAFAVTLAVLTVQPSPAGITIAENGRPRAVIVHNGHNQVAPNLPENDVRQGHIRPAVDTLRDYLKQITGAELPLVATAAAAEGKPAIVLELVDRVPLRSQRARASTQCAMTRGSPSSPS